MTSIQNAQPGETARDASSHGQLREESMAPTPTSDAPGWLEREAVARIVDPLGYELFDEVVRCQSLPQREAQAAFEANPDAPWRALERRDAALAKADQILALVRRADPLVEKGSARELAPTITDARVSCDADRADRLAEVTRQLIAVRLNRPSHADLCRLSLMFGRSSDLRTDQDIRINEWLKAQIADAKGEL